MSTNTIIKLTLAQDRLRQYPDKEKLKTLADKALYEYQRYFTDEILSPIGAKQAMNNLRKLFREYQDISNDLLKFRRMMDRNLSGGLKEINNYLLDIANG